MAKIEEFTICLVCSDLIIQILKVMDPFQAFRLGLTCKAMEEYVDHVYKDAFIPLAFLKESKSESYEVMISPTKTVRPSEIVSSGKYILRLILDEPMCNDDTDLGKFLPRVMVIETIYEQESQYYKLDHPKRPNFVSNGCPKIVKGNFLRNWLVSEFFVKDADKKQNCETEFTIWTVLQNIERAELEWKTELENVHCFVHLSLLNALLYEWFHLNLDTGKCRYLSVSYLYKNEFGYHRNIVGELCGCHTQKARFCFNGASKLDPNQEDLHVYKLSSEDGRECAFAVNIPQGYLESYQFRFVFIPNFEDVEVYLTNTNWRFLS